MNDQRIADSYAAKQRFLVPAHQPQSVLERLLAWVRGAR